MPFKGFFELRTARDLFGKLERDLACIQNNPIDGDAAFDFFITAYHMLDWLHPGFANKGVRNEIEKRSVLLQIASQLANGSKHFEATAAKHKSVATTEMHVGAFQAGAFQANGFDVSSLWVNLEGEAAVELGVSVNVLDLAGKLIEFWRKELKPDR
jgi:hypothetical protein